MGADSMCGTGNIFISDTLVEGMKVSEESTFWPPITFGRNYFHKVIGKIDVA